MELVRYFAAQAAPQRSGASKLESIDEVVKLSRQVLARNCPRLTWPVSDDLDFTQPTPPIVYVMTGDLERNYG